MKSNQQWEDSQSKTSDFTPTRVAMIKKTITNIGKNMEKLKLLYITSENWKHMSTKTCTEMFTAALFKNQKAETIQMSIEWWIDKENIVYSHNRLLFGNYKEMNTDTCYNMVETWKHFYKMKRANHNKPYIVWFHSYEIPKISKSMQSESTLMVAYGWGGWVFWGK